MRGRPKAELELDAEERRELAAWSRGDDARAERARIVLRCAQGADNKTVAAALGVAEHTVSKWRRRFVSARLAGLGDQPRQGKPRRIDGDVVARTVLTTIAEPPPNQERWTTRALTSALGLSQSAVARIWRDYGLGSDSTPSFADDVRDVIGVYRHGRERVVAVLTGGRVRGGSGGRLAHGTQASLPRAGAPASDLGAFLGSLEGHLAPGLELYLVITQCQREARTLWEWQGGAPQRHLHFVATEAAWSQLVDGWLARLGAPAPVPSAALAAPTTTLSRYLALRGGPQRNHKPPGSR